MLNTEKQTINPAAPPCAPSDPSALESLDLPVFMRTATVAERQGIMARKAGELAYAANRISPDVTLIFGGQNVERFSAREIIQALHEQKDLDVDRWFIRHSEGTNVSDARDIMETMLLAATHGTVVTVGAIGGTPELRKEAVDLLVKLIETENFPI